MTEFLFLMHSDVREPVSEDGWNEYIEKLISIGAMRAGSAIGDGRSIRSSGRPANISDRIVGYLKVEAESIDHAEKLLSGNPIYEANGTVEIRELPETP